MKRRTLFVFIGILTLVFVFPFLTTATAQSKAKPIELKVATWNPPQINLSKTMRKWADMVEERSGGRVKITFYWAQALAAYLDTYRATQSGIAEMGTWVIGIISGLHPLNEYNSLPLLGYDSMATLFLNQNLFNNLTQQFAAQLLSLLLVLRTLGDIEDMSIHDPIGVNFNHQLSRGYASSVGTERRCKFRITSGGDRDNGRPDF